MIRITNNTREKHKYLFSKYDDRNARNFNKQWISNITESANQLHGIVNNRRNVERRAGKYFVCFSYESLRNLWSQIDENLEQIEYYIEERKQNGAPSTITDKKNQRRFELFFRDVMLLIGYNNNIVRIRSSIIKITYTFSWNRQYHIKKKYIVWIIIHLILKLF